MKQAILALLLVAVVFIDVISSQQPSLVNNNRAGNIAFGNQNRLPLPPPGAFGPQQNHFNGRGHQRHPPNRFFGLQQNNNGGRGVPPPVGPNRSFGPQQNNNGGRGPPPPPRRFF